MKNIKRLILTLLSSLAVFALPAQAWQYTRDDTGIVFSEKSDLKQQIADARDEVTVSDDYLLNLQSTDKTLYCLAQNAFFEAKSESFEGKLAIVQVVKNRLDSGRYPGTLCAVVYQKNSGICQFSWWCNSRGEIPLRDRKGIIRPEILKQWRDSVIAAKIVHEGLIGDVVHGATHFYAHSFVRPIWVNRMSRTAVIGNHTFMRPKM